MRTLSATLAAAQKAPRWPLVKAVISSGATSYTYYGSRAATSRIMKMEATFEEDRYAMELLFNDSDKTLKALDLKGWKVVPSWGFTTTDSDEYSTDPSLYVIGQQQYSGNGKNSGLLFCTLSCAGIINLINEDQASAEYTLASDDTQTIKTLFQKVAGDTGTTLLGCFSHCTAWDVVFDSEDSLIDSYTPKDCFSIRRGQNRLSVLKELLAFTGCKMRIQNDDKIHVFVPVKTTSTAWQATHAYVVGDRIVPTVANEVEYKCTVAGTSGGTEPTWPTEVGQTVTDGTAPTQITWTVSYDYDYRLESGYHTFFNETYRKRLVVPNYVVVSSRDQDTSDNYTGYATNGQTPEIRIYKTYKVASNAQCTSIAQAILDSLEMKATCGTGVVPMNVGAELFDFVKVKDTRLADYRVGNIGYFHKLYDNNTFRMDFAFGTLAAGLAGTIPPTGGGGGSDWGTIINQHTILLEQIFAWINNPHFHTINLYNKNDVLVGLLTAMVGDDIELIASLAGSNVWIYSSSATGGTVIGGGGTPTAPADGEVLLDGATQTKVKTKLIIPGKA